MGVSRLEHVNIRCARLAATKAFYIDIIGLADGPRPKFPFGGAWLYCGDTAVIHLVDAADHPGSWTGTLEKEVGARASNAASGLDTGAFDHVAFHGEDFDGMREALRMAGLKFRDRVVPGTGLKQIFVPDPEGVMVELNFDA
jgi:catechol 2,3-dioxygenase-like lactoylglutathione lyase family enzyme